jgi:hypothetical protein
MAITDYIPNIFGSAAPTTYDSLQTLGLISPQQLEQQKKTANIQGLLGAGLALAQGMSRIGPRRSAAENIFGALAGGFGAAGGAYQQGLQNIVQQQQLQSAALQQQQAINRIESIKAAKLKYPDLAPLADIDTGKFAEEVALRERLQGIGSPTAGGQEQSAEGLRSIAQRYYAAGPNFKALGDSYMEQANRLESSQLATLTGKETPDQLRALSVTAASRGNKALADQLEAKANTLELNQAANVTGAESVDQLRAMARTAAARGNKTLADQLEALATRKELEPTQVTAFKPAAEVKQEPLQSGLLITPDGQTVVGVPDYSKGQRYVDETLHQQALERARTLQAQPVEADRGRLGNIQMQIDQANAEIARLGKIPTQDAGQRIETLSKIRDGLQADLNRFSVMEYDFSDLKKLPNKYQGEISQIEKQAQGGVLDAAGLNSRIQQVYTRLQEDEKGKELSGNAAIFAQMKFNKTKRTDLTGPELAQILQFENAPTAEQIVKLQQANEDLKLKNIQTQFETGRGVGATPAIPTSREALLAAPAPNANVAPVVAPPVVPAAAPRVSTRTAPRVEQVQTTDAAPRVAVPTTAAQANSPAETRGLYQYNKTALINQPDFKYSPKKKMELREKQAPLQSAVTYSLTSIKDSRDAAQALKNNPQYIDALTGRFSPLLGGTIGGIVINQDAKTANALLENILTRTFVGEIQAMRDASPTGGAVGSVTEKEMDALSKIRASLSVGMNKDEFIKQLDNYLSIANRSLKNIPIEYSKTFGYNGEFDEVLTAPGVSTTRTSGQDPVQQELNRRR